MPYSVDPIYQEKRNEENERIISLLKCFDDLKVKDILNKLEPLELIFLVNIVRNAEEALMIK